MSDINKEDEVQGLVSFSTLDGALENWGKLNDRRHVWREIGKIIQGLEELLGDAIEFRIPESRPYVAAYFPGSKLVGAFIQVGFVDHHIQLEGSSPADKGYFRSYLTSATNPSARTGEDKSRNALPCPKCGVEMPTVGGCDYCGE